MPRKDSVEIIESEILSQLGDCAEEMQFSYLFGGLNFLKKRDAHIIHIGESLLNHLDYIITLGH
jgi:hypothetical protein